MYINHLSFLCVWKAHRHFFKSSLRVSWIHSYIQSSLSSENSVNQFWMCVSQGLTQFFTCWIHLARIKSINSNNRSIVHRFIQLSAAWTSPFFRPSSSPKTPLHRRVYSVLIRWHLSCNGFVDIMATKNWLANNRIVGRGRFFSFTFTSARRTCRRHDQLKQKTTSAGNR